MSSSLAQSTRAQSTRDQSARDQTTTDPGDFVDPFEIPSTYVRDADTDTSPLAEPTATIVVKGRNVDVPDHFRRYVAQKLARLERYDSTLYHFDVELDHERNRRQSKSCQHVEITARGKGPVVRAEACAENFYAALEAALAKTQSRLRRIKDRRRVSYGSRTPISVAEATADADVEVDPLDGADPYAGKVEHYEPGHVVRVKDHPAEPMTVDDALYQMELVGHDFFLFHDSETDRPSVVYRRHAFDYGLIRLA